MVPEGMSAPGSYLRRGSGLSFCRVAGLFGLLFLVIGSSADADIGGLWRNRECRSLNTDVYEVSIYTNGRAGLALVSGETVFDGACPYVWFEGDDEPKRLRMKGRRSARMMISDALGEGHGLAVRGKQCLWTIQAYPTQPYLAARVVFLNDGRKPVRIKALSPWSVGDVAKGTFALGPVDEQATVYDARTDSRGALPRGETLRKRHIALENPVTERVLVAGFLEGVADSGQICTTLSESGQSFRSFSAVRVFDPPAAVAPGEILDSGLLYLSVGETDIRSGANRRQRLQESYGKE